MMFVAPLALQDLGGALHLRPGPRGSMNEDLASDDGIQDRQPGVLACDERGQITGEDTIDHVLFSRRRRLVPVDRAEDHLSP